MFETDKRADELDAAADLLDMALLAPSMKSDSLRQQAAAILDYDPEVPAGYSDADMLQSSLEAAGRRSAALRARGICDHGWTQGLAASGEWCGEGAAPAVGFARCLHCGEDVPDPFCARDEQEWMEASEHPSYWR